MPPESRTSYPPTIAHRAGDADEPHPGCNCGRRRAPRTASPLLTDDLVIAARARAREPELPDATVARALAAPAPSRRARYDVIVLDEPSGAAESQERLAAEFARHEHRVFHFVTHPHPDRRPTAPSLHRLALPAAHPNGATGLLATLHALRETEDIEAAVVFAPPTLDAAAAGEIRRRWGWRIVTPPGAPAALRDRADLRIALEAQVAIEHDEPSIALPPAMSWPERWATLDRAIRAAWPRASIIVVTWDNLAFTRLCLASILENTDYPNYELIVVDNASTDGTVAELQRLAGEIPDMQVVLNDRNVGFGPANNQGMAAASGDLLVLLNNDTVVPRGWLTRLGRHLEDPRVGLIGPGTNRTCNEAQIDIDYQTYGEYQAVARAQGHRHQRERYPIRMPMMFCLAFRRDTYELLGPLDEQYETGMFEDEDYALRAKAARLEVAWTPEVYVHHAYHASIGKLLPSGEYMRLVELNQGRFEEKWGICWERHRPAPTPAP